MAAAAGLPIGTERGADKTTVIALTATKTIEVVCIFHSTYGPTVVDADIDATPIVNGRGRDICGRSLLR